MKKYIVIIFIVLFYSCSTNKTLEKSKSQKINSFENEYFSLEYPKSWKIIKARSSYSVVTFSPKSTIRKGVYESDSKRIYRLYHHKLNNEKFREKIIEVTKEFSNVSVFITIINLDKKQKFKNYVEEIYNSVFLKYGKADIVKLLDNEAIVLTTVSNKHNSIKHTSLDHYELKGNTIYLISYSSTVDRYSKYMEDFGQILSSFKIKKLPKN